MPPKKSRGPGSRVAKAGSWGVGRLAVAVGAGAFLAVLATLGQPGITIDEPLDVRPGRTYLEALKREGLGFFGPESVRRVFADNAEHPPLGRWLLGLASVAGEPVEALLGGPDPFGVHAARLAPAVCFGLLVGLVSFWTGRRAGRAGGVAAGLALVAMPRVFAHAHLGALDTFLALFWTAALLAAGSALERDRPVRGLALAGLVWGLALLTKIHAWLLPPLVLAYALARLRPARAIGAVAAWTTVGLAVYLAGWPWLWYETLTRLAAYLGTGVERIPLKVLYFGQVYLDREVPWHFPWVYFATTVPVALQALGLVGLARVARDLQARPATLLPVGAIGLVLALFSTRVPVYDGERLFLVVFPSWAVLIGLGFAAVWDRCPPGRLRLALATGLAAQVALGLAPTHPFGLSGYNLLVGGLPGATRLGLEPTYWGDSVDRVLLDELARRAEPGQTAAVAPTLHHVQAAASTTPGLAARKIRLLDESEAGTADWVVVYRREAYWRPEIHALVANQAPVFVRMRQGVWLSALYRRNPPRSP